MLHGLDAVQHPFVHVDVDDLGTVFDLLAGHLQGFGEFVFPNQSSESGGTRDVCAFTDINE